MQQTPESPQDGQEAPQVEDLGYTGEPCARCGRIRVVASTDVCEKCNWHQGRAEYAMEWYPILIRNAPIDDEQIAALLDGRLSAADGRRLLAQLAASEDDYQVFVRTSAQMRELELAAREQAEQHAASAEPLIAILTQERDSERAAREALEARVRVLSAFARTAPGRLPQHVQDALAPWEPAALSSPTGETPQADPNTVALVREAFSAGAITQRLRVESGEQPLRGEDLEREAADWYSGGEAPQASEVLGMRVLADPSVPPGRIELRSTRMDVVLGRIEGVQS